MANDKIYIHEFIDIRGHNRAKYMHHMTANWVPIAIRERNQFCYGVWATLGSTGRWPEVVNMWELDGWAGLASNFEHEVSHPSAQDPSLAAWWAQAAEFRRGGFDRILVPAPWTRTIAELLAAEIRGVAYAHELVTVPPGRASAYLDVMASVGAGALQSFGFETVGGFSVAMGDDSECVALWAIPSWNAWVDFESGQDAAALRDWRDALSGLGASWRRTLLIDSALSPMRIGRQPQESDRKPLDSV